MSSYQEQMLRLALERHFETEKENFCNRQYKIKTLALFFIDDISSYRANEEGKTPPYLLEAFERLLKEKLNQEIQNLTEHETAYKDYLQASLNELSACHAGYFHRTIPILMRASLRKCRKFYMVKKRTFILQA